MCFDYDYDYDYGYGYDHDYDCDYDYGCDEKEIEREGFQGLLGGMTFAHEKLDVYRASLEFVAFVSELLPKLSAAGYHMRDQLFRASTSIPLNIAEANAKRTSGDRRRFLDIARGSAMESAAALDVLAVCKVCSQDQIQIGKSMLLRIVAMLSKMTEPSATTVHETELLYDLEYNVPISSPEGSVSPQPDSRP